MVRSAGSKGPIDLVALGGISCRLIQVKAGADPPKADLLDLEAFAGTIPAFAKVELWLRTGPKRFRITQVHARIG